MRSQAMTEAIDQNERVTLSLRDRRYNRVALAHELRRPRQIPFEKQGNRWQLDWDVPAADRVEYMLEVEHRGGRVEQIPDPENPVRVAGLFGEKSVLELPAYAQPSWTEDDESAPGGIVELELHSRLLRTAVTATLWSAADTDPVEPLPLLLVHDGPQYAEYSLLLRLLDHLVAFGELGADRREWERRAMIAALAPVVDAGRLKVYCVDS